MHFSKIYICSLFIEALSYVLSKYYNATKYNPFVKCPIYLSALPITALQSNM